MNTLQPEPSGAFAAQRQAFEAWYEADAMPMEGDWFRRDPDSPDEYESAMTSTAWRAWLASAIRFDGLAEEVAELGSLRDRLADLLTRTAVALRGPEPPLTRYSWHDIPDRAAAAVAAIDVMQRAAIMAANPELANTDAQGRR